MTKYLPSLWIDVLSFVTIQLNKTISVRPAESEGFSATQAMNHINVMVSDIHRMGTKKNRITP